MTDVIELPDGQYRGAARAGLTWHYARPPVIEFDYEMDTRCVTREILI